jgi:hypothetical protein
VNGIQTVDYTEAESGLPATGEIALDLHAAPSPPMAGSMTQAQFEQAVHRAKEAIAAGDAFQIVLSQRLQRATHLDPCEVYRALRIVNPSPYQVYLQARDCILVASSPEIACRVRGRTVTNSPLAGTRPRVASPDQDAQLERELLADPKERAEHAMLVDLGRNDLGRVCEAGSVNVDRCMDVERYSHVMHLSSTVTGTLRPGLDAWDALQWLTAHAASLGADGSRMAVGGDSAGGTLAAACAIQARDAGLALALQLLIYPGTTAHQDTDSHCRFAHGLVLEEASITWFFAQYIARRQTPDARIARIGASLLCWLPMSTMSHPPGSAWPSAIPLWTRAWNMLTSCAWAGT